MSKKLPGNEYRKRAKAREKEAKQSSSLLSSWLNSGTEVQNECLSEIEKNSEIEPESEVVLETGEKSENRDILSTQETPLSHKDEENFCFDFRDPGTWPNGFSDSQRCFVTRMRETELDPDINLKDTLRDGRHLTKDWFFKQMPNGQRVRRSWLVYSKSKNALYCLPCRLFAVQNMKLPNLAKEEGFTQWKKLNERIPEHENSFNHKKNFCSWKTLQSSFGKFGIDKELQDQIKQEENHWKAVLRSIVDVILHLAKQGSPLRGSKESFEATNRKGQFLNTIELVSHYHPPLREHLERHKKGQVSYFSPEIQNEFLDIIAGKIREQITQDIKEATYFSIMFDCTPDVSHLEQMSQIIRYIKINKYGPEIKESFIDFLTVSEKTGIALAELIIRKLEKDGLDINNCRGQSYDNGANMAGKYKGAQTFILKENPLAYFIPCAAHSLNLVGVNAAKASRIAQKYFGTLQCLYSFFAASTFRWEILRKYVTITLKSQAKTRWSAKLEAVKAVYMHLKDIINALEDLRNRPGINEETKSEAASLAKNIQKFKFIVMSCFWYKVLSHIDLINKLLQKESITIDISVRHIHGLITLLQSVRESTCTDAILEATKVAASIDQIPEVNDRRKRKRNDEESCQLSEDDLFRASLLEIMDRVLSELQKRFKALEQICLKFNFLHGSMFHSLSVDELKERASKLAKVYNGDIAENEITPEVESFKYHALNLDEKVKNASPLELLTFIYRNGLQDAYPNISTALRIFISMPVSVASNERSFSKLKLIKTHLRNTIGQQRLTNISIISIEHELASKLSYDDIISSFAAKKARKIKFFSS